jgi:hypothetical protein
MEKSDQNKNKDDQLGQKESIWMKNRRNSEEKKLQVKTCGKIPEYSLKIK